MFLAFGEVDYLVFRTWEQVCERKGTDPLKLNVQRQPPLLIEASQWIGEINSGKKEKEGGEND